MNCDICRLEPCVRCILAMRDRSASLTSKDRASASFSADFAADMVPSMLDVVGRKNGAFLGALGASVGLLRC